MVSPPPPAVPLSRRMTERSLGKQLPRVSSSPARCVPGSCASPSARVAQPYPARGRPSMRRQRQAAEAAALLASTRSVMVEPAWRTASGPSSSLAASAMEKHRLDAAFEPREAVDGRPCMRASASGGAASKPRFICLLRARPPTPSWPCRAGPAGHWVRLILAARRGSGTELGSSMHGVASRRLRIGWLATGCVMSICVRTGAVKRYRPPAPARGSREAEEQAQEAGAVAQLLLHGRQVPGVLPDVRAWPPTTPSCAHCPRSILILCHRLCTPCAGIMKADHSRATCSKTST